MHEDNNSHQISTSEIGSASLSLYHVFGIDSPIRHNVIRLNDNEILYLSGKIIVKLDLTSKERTYVFNTACEGLSCMKTDEKRRLLFIGEHGLNPSIVVCSLPDFNILYALKGGAERGYACLDVSQDGKRMCSVSIEPDYMLTIWDLTERKVKLFAKAFTNDVVNVSFSPYVADCITTSGKGHIRFWKTAITFTGLKLQEQIGKFGKIDLSDIVTFAHLPNGMIISGSETGHLLLWEGGFLKCRFILKDIDNEHQCDPSQRSLPAHNGGIYYLHFDELNSYIISAGVDGTIKWWSYQNIELAEVDLDSTMEFIMDPIRTLLINGVKICHIAGMPPTYKDIIIQDNNGGMWRTDLEGKSIVRIWDYHGGIISGLCVSPCNHIAVTCGMDGYIRCWHFLKRMLLVSTAFVVPCTSIAWVPKTIDSTCRSLIIGFADGLVRYLYITKDAIICKESSKPHIGAVRSLVFDGEGKFLITSSEDGKIFIFKSGEAFGSKSMFFIPFGFIVINDLAQNLTWRENWASFQYDTEDEKGGSRFEVDLREELEARAKKTSQMLSYCLPIVPEVVNSACTKLILPSKKEISDYFFVHRSESTITGKCTSYDRNFILTTDSVGLLVIFRVNLMSGSLETPGNTSTTNDSTFQLYFGGKEGSTDQPIGFPVINGIIDSDVINHVANGVEKIVERVDSLEEELVRKREGVKEIAAIKKKNSVRRILAGMRQDYSRITTLNKSLPVAVQVCQTDIDVDATLYGMYEAIECTEIDKVKNEHQIKMVAGMEAKTKLEDFFCNILDCDHFVITGIQNDKKVHSIPTLKLKHSFQQIWDYTIDNLSKMADVHNSTRNKDSNANDVCDVHMTINLGQSDNISSTIERKDQSTFETRMVKRKERKKKLEQKRSEKPENEDDSRDVQAILDAKANCGDWKLKASEAYMVPEGEGMSVLKKLEEMIILEKSMYMKKMSYNSELVKMKERRHQLVKSIAQKKERIKQIARALGEISEGHYLHLNLGENLEEEKEVGDQMNYRSQSNVIGPNRGNSMSLQSILPHAITHSTQDIPFDALAEDLSLIELDEMKERKALLQHERSTILQNVAMSVADFDESIYKTCKQRFQLMTEIKAGQICLMVKLQEIKLLKLLEERDTTLAKRCETCVIKKQEIVSCVSNHKKLLDEKKAELDLCIEKHHSRLNEFDDIVPESHPHFQYLKNIFMRKVRRNLDSDFESDEEEEDADVNNSGEWDMSDEEDDICPEGCSLQTCETVIKLRDNRLRQEEEVKIFQREVERLKQTHGRFCIKERQANRDSQDMKEEIQLFQTEKQHAFNGINTTVPFSLKQMYLWENNDDMMGENKTVTAEATEKATIKVHSIMGESVVFPNLALYKLRQRIRDLAVNIKDDKQNFNFLQKEWRRMEKEVFMKQQHIREQKERCNELQMLKFGQLVDIDALDKISVGDSKNRSKVAADKISKIAGKNMMEIKLLEIEQESLRMKLKEETIVNTSILNQIAELSEMQIGLEKNALGKGKKNISAIEDEFIEKLDVEEEERLKKLHVDKGKEIDKLKDEIKRLQRKDGENYSHAI